MGVNVLSLTELTDPTGATFYAVNSGSLDRKITYENLVLAITGKLDNLITKYQDASKSAAFTRIIPANCKLDSIDFLKISGTPVVKIGTTLGGEEVLVETTINNSSSLNSLISYFEASDTLYISISGGVVTINFNLYEDTF